MSGYSITLSCMRGSQELFGLCPVPCPGCGLLLSLQQPKWDCTGLCFQRLVCPSTSESRDLPAILGCCQEPRLAFDSLRTLEIHVLSPYTCVYTQGTEGGTCWRSGCHPELGQNTHTHTQRSACPRRDKGLQYFSVSPPKTTYHPILPQQKAEMRIFRELIFRMIHSQKGGMKGFL